MAAQSGDKILAERLGIVGSISVQDIVDLGLGGQTRRVCQVRNAAQIVNVNQATWEVKDIGGTVDFTHADYTPGTDQVVCNFSGTVKLTAHLYFNATATRANPNCRITINGTALSPIGASGYIRNAGGHTASSISIPGFEATVSNGDIVRLETVRESSSTSTVSVQIGDAYLLLERWA